jgi:hypothetical protein
MSAIVTPVSSIAACTRLARCSSNGSRRSRVLATGSSIASAGTSASDGCRRGGQLDAVGAELLREAEPLLDREVRVGVALLARRQLLQRGGQHADRHEGWIVGLRLGHERAFL